MMHFWVDFTFEKNRGLGIKEFKFFKNIALNRIQARSSNRLKEVKSADDCK